MKDKEIQGYVNADKKAKKLWKKSKNIDNPKRQEKFKEKAQTAFAERDAYAMRLQHPKTEVKSTDVTIKDSFNGNFSKTKTTKVNTRAKFNFWKNKK